MLRELREEIALTSFESAVPVSGFSHRPDYRRGEGAIFVVQEARDGGRLRWRLLGNSACTNCHSEQHRLRTSCLRLLRGIFRANLRCPSRLSPPARSWEVIIERS
jgi:hypothetical protein